MPAEKCITTVEKKISTFKNLTGWRSCLNNRWCCSYDKGGEINVRHQLCLAHTIQLVVIKIIYNNNKKNPQEILKETISEDSDYDEDEEDVRSF